MEQIEFKDIREGDYICVVDMRCKKDEPKFPSVYLKVDYIEGNVGDDTDEVISNIWVEFNSDGNFQDVRKEEGTLADKGCLHYRLNEEEFGVKVNKYIILNSL